MNSIIKRLLCAALVFVTLLSLSAAALATEVDEAPTFSAFETPLTPEELAEIEADNVIINAYYLAKLRLRATTSKTLSVSAVQQSNTYYCGPAVALMSANFLGLARPNGSLYTQATIAAEIGTTSAGSSSDGITSGLNSILAANGKTARYQRTTIAAAPLAASVVYSIDNNMPVIISVATMPSYTANGGHFMLIKGYSQSVSGGAVTTTVTYIDPHWNSAYFGTYSALVGDMTNYCNSNAGKYIRKNP